MKIFLKKYTRNSTNKWLVSDNMHATFIGAFLCSHISNCFVCFLSVGSQIFLDFRCLLDFLFELVMDFWLRVHCQGIKKMCWNLIVLFIPSYFSKSTHVYLRLFVRWNYTIRSSYGGLVFIYTIEKLIPKEKNWKKNSRNSEW